MRKIIALTLSLIFVLGLLTACGGQNEEKIPTTNNDGMNQSQPDSQGGNQADPNSPRVWRTAQRGKYENGAWANSGLRYERNAYGLYTSIDVYDENGNKIGNNAKISETYDSANRLTKFDNGNEVYFFTYDQAGKMSEICVQDMKGRNLVKLTYGADGGYCAVDYDENYTDTYETIVYNKDLKRISYESVRQGKISIRRDYTYNSDGLLATQTYSKSQFDYHEEYTYNKNGKLVKLVTTETLIGTDSADEYIEEYTYSAAGNLLTYTGIKYGDPSYPDGLIFANEEYTDADYDEGGECLYYYDVKKNTWTGEYTFEKEPSPYTWTYEYAEEGWLLQKNRNDGGFTRYDKNGNVVMDQNGASFPTYGYEEYSIIDDDLLVTFYKLFGDDFV